jgi:integrase
MTISELRALIEQDRRNNGRGTNLYPLKHVERLLGGIPLEVLRTADVERFKATRLEEGAEPGTVNQALALLRRGYALAMRQEFLDRAPYIQKLRENPPREGFLEVPAFRKLVKALEVLDQPVADAVAWLYGTGWRRREALGLEWTELELETGHITLPAERVKTRTIRRIKAPTALLSMLKRRWEARSGPLVFHRGGGPIVEFRGPWTRAVEAAGVPWLIPHDMRRSFCHVATQAGVAQKVIMELGGWVTISTFQRYNIVSDAQATAGLEAVERFISKYPAA